MLAHTHHTRTHTHARTHAHTHTHTHTHTRTHARTRTRTRVFPKALARGERGRQTASSARRVSVAATEAAEAARLRLVAIFRAHAPDKLPNVPALLARYAGQEDELLRKVAGKYGLGGGTSS